MMNIFLNQTLNRVKNGRGLKAPSIDLTTLQPLKIVCNFHDKLKVLIRGWIITEVPDVPKISFWKTGMFKIALGALQFICWPFFLYTSGNLVKKKDWPEHRKSKSVYDLCDNFRSRSRIRTKKWPLPKNLWLGVYFRIRRGEGSSNFRDSLSLTKVPARWTATRHPDTLAPPT